MHPNPVLATERRCRHAARYGNQNGFSSVEILIAAAVGLAVMTAFVAVNHYQLGTLRREAKQLRMRGAGRSVTDLFAREARRADTIELLPQVNGMRIRADLDRSGTTDGANDSPEEDVLYGLYDGALWRKSGGPNGEDAWERLSSETESPALDWFFLDRSGNELAYDEVLALPAGVVDSMRRVGLRLNLSASGEADASAGTQVQQLRLASDSTLRKRFFVQSANGGVNDAIYQSFDVDTFLDGLETPVAATNTPVPATPTPSSCNASDQACSSNAQCCSGVCRPNGRCQ